MVTISQSEYFILRKFREDGLVFGKYDSQEYDTLQKYCEIFDIELSYIIEILNFFGKEIIAHACLQGIIWMLKKSDKGEKLEKLEKFLAHGMAMNLFPKSFNLHYYELNYYKNCNYVISHPIIFTDYRSKHLVVRSLMKLTFHLKKTFIITPYYRRAFIEEEYDSYKGHKCNKEIIKEINKTITGCSIKVLECIVENVYDIKSTPPYEPRRNILIEDDRYSMNGIEEYLKLLKPLIDKNPDKVAGLLSSMRFYIARGIKNFMKKDVIY